MCRAGDDPLRGRGQAEEGLRKFWILHVHHNRLQKFTKVQSMTGTVHKILQTLMIASTDTIDFWRV